MCRWVDTNVGLDNYSGILIKVEKTWMSLPSHMLGMWTGCIRYVKFKIFLNLAKPVRFAR